MHVVSLSTPGKPAEGLQSSEGRLSMSVGPASMSVANLQVLSGIPMLRRHCTRTGYCRALLRQTQQPAATWVCRRSCLPGWLFCSAVYCHVISCSTMSAAVLEVFHVWHAAGSDMEQAVQVAQGAGFQQAVARAHYLAGNFLQALHCAIHATSTPGLPPYLKYCIANAG